MDEYPCDDPWGSNLMKLHELTEARRSAQTDDERREYDQLIEERIRLIGSGQGDEP
ncbi:hypothetical protein [Pseudoxanthomonas indica]|uniref:Uncharacterized protein n=1 Tax=Pseudoxanthomonas indica TaxID=428993 RepID=A0A1T5IJM7_9GAMM|nr:hypothetical protein [Pseudoxanthomonas indica]GGD52566.1 hypothetical protein GCM10007235_25970 [Pseudoxanthomonas indica]SKC39355.1 hypothetical protein SAMN06296058_0013 [Pseudoxanthomonas indica]